MICSCMNTESSFYVPVCFTLLQFTEAWMERSALSLFLTFILNADNTLPLCQLHYSWQQQVIFPTPASGADLHISAAAAALWCRIMRAFFCSCSYQRKPAVLQSPPHSPHQRRKRVSLCVADGDLLSGCSVTWRFPFAGLFLFRVVAGHVAQQSWEHGGELSAVRGSKPLKEKFFKKNKENGTTGKESSTSLGCLRPSEDVMLLSDGEKWHPALQIQFYMRWTFPDGSRK